MHAAELPERPIVAQREIVTNAQVGLKRRRACQWAADSAAGRGKGLPTERELVEVDRSSIIPEEWRGLRQLSVVPGSAAAHRQRMRHAGGERSLETLHLVFAAVRREPQVPGNARVENCDLRIFPV